MKASLALIGAAAAILVGVAVGVQANASSDPLSGKGPMEDLLVGGYEGWWNATPLIGSADHLPKETVAVNTTSNKIIDASNRALNDAGIVTKLSDVDFKVVPDSAWPKNSVVIIDTSSGLVIESFPVDEKGHVIYPETPSQ